MYKKVNLRKNRGGKAACRGPLLMFALFILVSSSMAVGVYTHNSDANGLNSPHPLDNGNSSFERRGQPAIVSGLANFYGTDEGQLFVYAYNGTAWNQIPFQVDDRNDGNGSYVWGIDSTYDSNDEIVFMPKDAGLQVGVSTWGPAGADADIRYEIAVTDPLTSETKYAYVFASSTLTYTAGDYVHYDSSTKTVSSNKYTLDLKDDNPFLVDGFSVGAANGGDGTNVLDRMKFRGRIDGIDVTEDNLKDQDYAPHYRYKSGPVRVIIFDNSFFYESVSTLEDHFNWNHDTTYFRISMDFDHNAGDMTYYDSNGNQLDVDGHSDNVANTAEPSWMQMSTAHGSVVSIWNVSIDADSRSLYYNDDSTVDDSPESDPGEWGDYGISANTVHTPQTIRYSITFYPLPSLSANQGSTYQSYVDNPLSVTKKMQYNGTTTERRGQPAIVSGLANFYGTDEGQLFVYAYNGTAWNQIPFQVDDRNDGNGSYVWGIDSTYDSNDEIVFMPKDAGLQVGVSTWGPAGADADIRYEIAVTDPLTSETKYAYVFASSTLTYTAGDYVHYDSSTKTVSSNKYTLDLKDDNPFLVDGFSVGAANGGDGTNVLDRMKFRGRIDGIDVTEDNLKDQDYAPHYRYKSGPVRVIIFDNSFFYESVSTLEDHFNWNHDTTYFRISMDFDHNAGDMTYYDSNGNQLDVDGHSDNVANTAEPSWMQMSTAHGSVVSIWNVSIDADSRSLYYNDDSTVDDSPESDPGEWGDYGISANTVHTPQTIRYSITFYPLPSLSANQGSTYQSYVDNPLSVTALYQNNTQNVTINPPTNLSAYVNGSNITLQWTDSNSTTVDHYNIYRSTEKGTTGSLVATVNPGVQQWSDVNVVGDGTDYFYTVRAADSNGNEDNNTVQVQKHDQQLSAGLNLISPLLYSSANLTSYNLLNGQSQGIAGCSRVQGWNSGSDSWEQAVLLGGNPHGTNFTIVPGFGYFVKVDSDVVWTTAGRVIDSPITLNLHSGLNLISVPYSTVNLTSYNMLDGQSQGIAGCTRVQGWNSGSDSWEQSVLLGGSPHGTNFAIVPGFGYFVKVDSDTTWTPQSNGGSPEPKSEATHQNSIHLEEPARMIHGNKGEFLHPSYAPEIFTKHGIDRILRTNEVVFWSP